MKWNMLILWWYRTTVSILVLVLSPLFFDDTLMVWKRTSMLFCSRLKVELRRAAHSSFNLRQTKRTVEFSWEIIYKLMITMITKVMPGWAHRWLVGGKELVMVLHLECHVLQDLDEQLCRKLDKSQLPVCTSTTTRASCLVEEIVRKYFTNFHKYFYWQETDWISWYIWKSFYNHLPFALSFPGAVRPGMRPHPHRRRRNRDLRPDLFETTVATKASHYFSLNHPPASGSCTSFNPTCILALQVLAF